MGGLMGVLGLALGMSDAHAQAVNETFDRISGERTIAYTADGSRDRSQPVFTFSATLSVDPPSASISLAFVSVGDGTGRPGAARFASCHDIAWSVDGQALTAAGASYRGQVIDGELIELLEQPVTAAWAARIGSARSAAYRVCRSQYMLSGADIDAFATIAARLKSDTLSTATPRGKPAEEPQAEVEYKGMNWRPGRGSLFRPR
jgi:hypothetical protein